MRQLKRSPETHPQVDFAALAVLIEAATRLRCKSNPTSAVTGRPYTVAAHLLRAQDSMSAREYVNLRTTLARLVLQIKRLGD